MAWNIQQVSLEQYPGILHHTEIGDATSLQFLRVRLSVVNVSIYINRKQRRIMFGAGHNSPPTVLVTFLSLPVDLRRVTVVVSVGLSCCVHVIVVVVVVAVVGGGR
jgi:hypothetical protein